MRTIALICAIGSLIGVGISAAVSPWYVAVIWGFTASTWAFTAGVEHANKAWKE